ncbi:MAG: stage II sporulation protein R [Ruminococcaceae bacterium]|nr:stage II sporulation protein R [Oscillospiraceae bacterium]
MKKRKLRIIITSFFCFVIFLSLWAVIPSAKECEIYNSTIRLHVLANSDSERDQEIKLKVRDALLEHISKYESDSKEQTLMMIASEREYLEGLAEQTLEKEGIIDTVSIKIGKEEYPRRDYEGFSLPAGEYTSVRVVIGEGKGQNWWCVLFPPLCTAQAIEYDDEAYISAGLTKEQYYMITGNSGEYEIKFKLLEIAANAFGFEY